MIFRVLRHSLTLLLFVLAACQGYDLKINERTVYTPDPLFEAFEVTDPALHTCLQETIASALITSPAQLQSLDCAHAGIATLDGLATFTSLTALRLSNNRVRNLVEIGKLTGLQELYLDGNTIVDAVPLYDLPDLTYLDLAHNPDLQCPHRTGFSAAVTVILPKHCRRR